MKVAITGATGHIGNCLVRELKKRGAEIKALVHTFVYDLEQLGAEIIYGNLLDIDSLKKLCVDADVVFHLAARITIDNRNSELTRAVNITGTENILSVAKEAGVKKFIHFSSIHAHNVHPLDEILDETRPLIETDEIVYEFTKAESERLVQRFVREGMDAVIINPTAVIGPHDFRKSYLGQALRMFYKNSRALLITGGYNWVDVRDVVSASIQAIEKGQKGEKYILSGQYCSLKELSALIGKVSGKKTSNLVLPAYLARLTCPFLRVYSMLTNNDPLYTFQSLDMLANSPKNISFKKARKELNYSPRPLEQTLTDTFGWYKKNGFLN